jgi:Kelch motif.
LNHHALFQTEDGELYIYGGYGNYLYSNKIFHYNQSRDQWEAVTLRGNPLPHRYYSASNQTPINDKIYFFGGIGNTTGEQIIGGKQFYDCYEMDINTFTVKKLWENKEKTDFVPANNLIFSKDGTHFYTACYNHYNPQSAITMNYYDVSNGSRIQVGDSIPLYSDRIETNINLYYSSKSNQFFIVSHVFKDKDESNITIYSINNTPIPASLLAEAKSNRKPK